MSSTINVEDIRENFKEDKHLIFGYTPMCGTCKISERMLDIANEILKLPVKKIDLNFHPEFSEENKIMSVPVLMVMNKDKEMDRIYAFQSVPYLLEKLK
ncbi:thioredoxin family protein [Staphylococcus petrasii]|uniref:thioredoxin family protein n=1 Tax=Staphylococcus petrasii TaxID=1276936 RepID=UPI000CCFED0F|nr:thioredoxin family protein [Staphylococcus petrasii]MCI2773574.1 thioredoxin family protein [Staphylococcus petrasii]PNZ82854.1 thioredoxin [Staphylococcus petrasii]TGA82247.1 thioredoxin [Staphylococcus petrasii]SUM60593.1 thioredoxin [Staphylococcus petrasii]